MRARSSGCVAVTAIMPAIAPHVSRSRAERVALGDGSKNLVCVVLSTLVLLSTVAERETNLVNVIASKVNSTIGQYVGTIYPVTGEKSLQSCFRKHACDAGRWILRGFIVQLEAILENLTQRD